MASQFEVSTSDVDNNSGSEEADLSRKWLAEISVKIPTILLTEIFPALYQRLPANSGISSQIKLNLFFIHL
jgi:hypothetical protein